MAAAATSQRENNKLVKHASLKHLLDGLVIAQKQDIQAFSKGHLNEANLPKPPDKASHASWQSATKPHINLVPRSKIPPAKHNTQNDKVMKETMLNFSMGTSGTAYVPRKPNPTPISKPPTVAERRSRASLRKSKVDGVLIEELSLPETMLVKTNYPDPKSKLHKSGPDLDTSLSESRELGSQSHVEPILPVLKHSFMPSHLEGVTKKDQLLKMRQFEEVVLRKQDVTEQNIMSGVKAVAHIETKLQQDLDELQHNGYGPNFHRLQVFSNVLHDVIQDSSTFGFILQTIKNEYDAYIASLMHGQTAKHQVLYSQVEQLASRDNNSKTLQHEVANVKYLEAQAKEMLAENERLREELGHEKYLTTKPVAEEVPESSRFHEAKQDLLETVEELKATILEKLDLMNSLKTKLRMEYVPSTVCSHLEQCIKETEVEIQKLTSQKEFFDRSISDMEKDLHQAIEMADTTEKDARRVWKRVTAVKAVDRSALNGTPGAGVTTTGPGGAINNPYDSDDGDDEMKWNWYIS